MNCDPGKLDELTALAQSTLESPLNSSGPNEEIFISNFVDVFLPCHQELVERANNNPNPESLDTIAAMISERLGIEEKDPNFNNVMSEIRRSLTQTAEKKSPGSGDSHKDNGAERGADPVMLYKGQFIHDVTDIQINGAGIDFTFNRSYRNQVIFNGPLGYNWTHNFHVWLREGEQVIFRSSGDLREEAYIKHPRFGETINGDFDYWMPPDGSLGIILSDGDSYALRQPDGTRHIFEADPKHSFLHRLARIEDRFGNYLDLTYDDETDQLKHIEINHPKRFVQFNYDAEGRICLIQDYTGRKWCYAYDSHGDLVTVTSPATDRYDCGLTVRYDYSSAFFSGNLQHNLTRIIDASGQIYLETEYGTSPGLFNFNRVVRQRQGGGEYQFEYKNIDQVFDIDYPDELRPVHQTILVERNGQAVCHIYNRFGNLLRRDQSIIENGLPRQITEQYRYNKDGNVITSLSPEGVFTQHLFGREYFLRKHGLTANNELPLDELTWKVRQAFSRVLATVRRGGYTSFNSFNMTGGEWGNFPDIIGGAFPISISNRAEDIIIKMTYEEEFGQILTLSDPRYTNSADPDEINEHPEHNDTLTRYTYSGQAGLLSKIEYPQPTLPDGFPGPVVQEEFTDYDSRGRLLRSVNQVGVVTELSYFDDQNSATFGHLQQTVVDVGGFEITVRNEVDDLGRVTAVHLPKSVSAADGRFVNQTVYNELNQVIETISTPPFNFKTRHFYDRNGKLEREESDLRDSDGQLELGGRSVATYCYDEEFNPVESSVGGLDLDAHLVTKNCYDHTGKLVLTIFPNGNQLRIRYDERQLPVAQISGAGSDDAAEVRTDYDGDGRVRRTFDARGNPTTFDFDPFGRVISEEDAIGNIIRTDYDKAGNVTCNRVFEKKDNGYSLLSRSETEYDELDRAIFSRVNRFDDPIGPFDKNELDDTELNSPGPGAVIETITFYDSKGRVTKTVDPRNRETHFEYDNLDRTVVVTDPLGNQTLNQYDDHNNVIRSDQSDRVLAEDGTELSKRFFASSSTYDELDRLTSTADSLGNTSRFFYDSRGNIVRSIDPLGNEQQFAFDIFNRPISTTQFLTPSGLGPVTSNAIPVTNSQEYDPNGNLTAVIDSMGRRTRYTYDALDRRRAVIYPNESRMLTDYDADGNVIRTKDNNGVQRFFTVDSLGRTIRIGVDKSGLPSDMEIAGATFERYEYDGLDRQIAAENDFSICRNIFNSVGWPLSETIEFTVDEAPIKTPFIITREFDDAGSFVGLTYPNGRVIQLDRDELYRLTKIENISNGTAYPGNPGSPDVRPITQFSYAGQQRSQCISANGASTTYRHDGIGRVIEIAHAGSSAPLLTIQYLFDATNNVRLRNDVLPNSTKTERFAYDSLYRLVNEINPASTETFDLSNFGPGTDPLSDPLSDGQSAINALIGSIELPQIPATYEYDLAGNRDIERQGGGIEIDYSNNSLDQYTARDVINYVHDKSGNLKNDEEKVYIYDSLNRLVTVKQAGGGNLIEYWHDALGRRILEKVEDTGTATQLIHDGDDIISEYRNGLLSAQYVFDDGIDRPMHIAAEGEEHWYHADLVGSVRVLSDFTGTDAVAYQYSPFGSLSVLTGNDVYNPWRYTARRFDVDLETYDYRARQYDPETGRFMQRDPLEMIDGTNLYSYTSNNPLSFSDPDGTNSRPESNFFNGTDRKGPPENYSYKVPLYDDPFMMNCPSGCHPIGPGPRRTTGSSDLAMEELGDWLMEMKRKADDTVMDAEYALRGAVSQVIETALSPVTWFEENTCGEPGCSAYTGTPPVQLFGRAAMFFRRMGQVLKIKPGIASKSKSAASKANKKMPSLLSKDGEVGARTYAQLKPTSPKRLGILHPEYNTRIKWNRGHSPRKNPEILAHELKHVADIKNFPRMAHLAFREKYFPGRGVANYIMEFRGYKAEGVLTNLRVPFRSMKDGVGVMKNFWADIAVIFGTAGMAGGAAARIKTQLDEK